MVDLILIKELIERDVITKDDKELFSEIIRNERSLSNFLEIILGGTYIKIDM